MIEKEKMGEFCVILFHPIAFFDWICYNRMT